MQIDSIPFTPDSQGLPADGYAYHIGRPNENPVNNDNKLDVFDGKDGVQTSNPFYIDAYGRFINVNSQRINPWVNEESYSITVLSPEGGVLESIPNWVSDNISSSSVQPSVVDATINNLDDPTTGAKVLDLTDYDTVYIQSINAGWEDTVPGPQDGFYAHKDGTVGPVSSGDENKFYDSAGNGFTRDTTQRIDEQYIDDIATNAADIAEINTKIVGPDQLDGFRVTYGSISTVSVAKGVCAESTNADLIVGDAATLDISAEIGAGGNAARPSTVSLTADTTYHIFLVTEADGSNPEYSYDTDIDALNALLAWSTETGESYTLYRRVRSVQTNGSSEIIEDFQQGNRVYRSLPVSLSTSIPTTSTPLDLAVPLGVECEVVLQSVMETDAGTVADVSLEIEDLNASGFYAVHFRRIFSGNSDYQSTEFYATGNTSAQINYLYATSPNILSTEILQRSYIDLGI